MPRVVAYLIMPAIAGLSACQKELSNDQLAPTCLVSKFSASAGPDLVEEVLINYDAVTNKPTTITHSLPDVGETRNLLPLYSRDTVFLGGGTFVVLDAGGRITHLREVTGLSNIADGDYYYTYNATNGTLAERIYDDGSAGPVERTRYIFTNDSLTRIEQDINGIANALIITLTYNNSSRLHGFAEYQYADFFPELIPYWSLLKLGRLPAWPLANSLYTVNIPPAPAFTLAIPFNGFTQTQPDGLLKSYSNTITVPGSGSTTYNYVLEYNCNP